MGTGKKKIEMKLKEKKEQRMVAFSKRRKGLFKKASELRSLTDTEIAVITFSPAGRPYVHGEPSFDAVINRYNQDTNQQQNDDNNKAKLLKLWLEAMEAKNYNSVYDLLMIKSKVEEVKAKIGQQIDLNFVDSILL